LVSPDRTAKKSKSTKCGRRGAAGFLSLKVKTKADAERLDFEPRAGLINIKQEESDYEK